MVSWFPPSSCGRSPRHEPAKEREGAPSSFPLRSRLNLFKVPSFFLAVLKGAHLPGERRYTETLESLVKGNKMIKSVVEFIEEIENGLSLWPPHTKPWFRGESEPRPRDDPPPPLRPKIADYTENQENYLLQSFCRQAGGLANVPLREHSDLWLFRAQHYGVPTRLLDWSEGALHALYFAINKNNRNPRVYMLNPRKLNELTGSKTFSPNYPLSWRGGGSLYIALAWQNRNLNEAQKQIRDEIPIDMNVPIAFPATYQDQRMIAQRSCFTIHGTSLGSIIDILTGKNVHLSEYLQEYKIDDEACDYILKRLYMLGVSAATIFPDLDHLAEDLITEIGNL